MAITDNGFTADEFSAAAKANPDLIKTVADTLKASEYVVHTKDEHGNYLKNYEDTVIAPKTREFASRIEKDVQEMTGIAKEGDEKYYDYMKRAVGKKIGSFEKVSKELEDLRKEKNPSQADRDRIALLEKAITDKEKEYGEKLSAKEVEVRRIKATQAISGAVAGLRAKYKEGLPKGIVELSENTVIDQLLNEVDFVTDSSGKEIIAFKDKDGKVRLNASFLPMTVEERLADTSLKEMLDEAKVKTGTGTGEQQRQQQQEQGKFAGIPAEVKSKAGLTEHLKKLGIMFGTKEFDEIFAKEEVQKLPLR